MELRIKIKTPKGAAKGYSVVDGMNINNFEKQIIHKIIFRKSKIKEEYINKDKSEICWLIETDARNYPSIIKNISFFDNIVSGIFENKTANKMISKLADSKEELEQVKKMLKKGTKIQVIKMNEKDYETANETTWERIKKTFRREK